ncbi:MAG TPA: hypothetical protein DCS30_10775 [Rhizobiales bacterium]|nr:hypothetical protein [Hyphomicrobiales bacterium]
MQPQSPPDILYHGTASRFLPSIFKKGLKSGSRQFVHLSKDKGHSSYNWKSSWLASYIECCCRKDGKRRTSILSLGQWRLADRSSGAQLFRSVIWRLARVLPFHPDLLREGFDFCSPGCSRRARSDHGISDWSLPGLHLGQCDNGVRD